MGTTPDEISQGLKNLEKMLTKDEFSEKAFYDKVPDIYSELYDCALDRISELESELKNVKEMVGFWRDESLKMLERAEMVGLENLKLNIKKLTICVRNNQIGEE